nr:hypothetical protein [Candidatus Enterovibrio luxaltus]
MVLMAKCFLTYLNNLLKISKISGDGTYNFVYIKRTILRIPQKKGAAC